MKKLSCFFFLRLRLIAMNHECERELRTILGKKDDELTQSDALSIDDLVVNFYRHTLQIRRKNESGHSMLRFKDVGDIINSKMTSIKDEIIICMFQITLKKMQVFLHSNIHVVPLSKF